MPRNKIILRGRMGQEEFWSVNLTFGTYEVDGAISGIPSLQAWANEIGNRLGAATANPAFAPLLSCLSSEGIISSVVAQYYADAGPITDQAEALVGKVGLGSLTKPYPTAVVCSLRTGLPGGSRRGRFYWPATGCTIGNSGRLQSTTHPEPLVEGFQWMLEQIADSAGGSLNIWPKVYSPTLDESFEVRSLLVGDVPDTQRRRRDGLNENYSSVVYDGAP